ncbi:MAG: M48 family metallopeptidase [Abditibacteriota bacterium]|nr:M48 family metallopeptidase [Abditibacteriota bacterium]
MKINKITRRRLKKHFIIARVNKDLSVNITIAPHVTKSQIISFLNERKEKINRLIENQRQKNREIENIKDIHKDEILLFGIWKKIVFSSETPFVTDEERIFLPNYMKFYDKVTLMNKVYNLMAEKTFPILLREEEKRTNLKALGLTITKTLSRWGSFNIKDEMKLSSYLVTCPIPVIKYVICHELCHKVHRNHQKNFHKLLAGFYPNSKEYEEILKETGKYIRSFK